MRAPPRAVHVTRRPPRVPAHTVQGELQPYTMVLVVTSPLGDLPPRLSWHGAIGPPLGRPGGG